MRELGVRGEVIPHEGSSGRTSEGAAEALGVPLERIVKTLIFTSEGRFVAVVARGDRRVNVDALRRVAGFRRRPRLASAGEVEELTGFSPGGLPPFAPTGRMPCYVSASVLEMDWVIGAAGTEFAGVKFDPRELLGLGFRAVDV